MFRIIRIRPSNKITVFAVALALLFSFIIPMAGNANDTSNQASGRSRGDDATHIEPIWWQTYGGFDEDLCEIILPASDGGYIIGGELDKSKYENSRYFLMMKINETGSEVWKRTYGGGESTFLNSIQATTDGGYALIGSTRMFSDGDYEAWIIKTDASGNELWNRTYGGERYYTGHSMCETSDSGFLILGDRTLPREKNDIWLVKTDSNGNVEWEETYGGKNSDDSRVIRPTGDGGFVILGEKDSETEDSIWLIKLNETGNHQWDRTYDHGQGTGWWVEETTDNGFVISGYTYTATKNDVDAFLLKTDEQGNEVWHRTYGGLDDDSSFSVTQTPDGGYVLTGYTESYGYGYRNVWLLKTNGTGIEQWNRTFGGFTRDEGKSILRTSDGNLLIGGNTYSFGEGREDIIVIETDLNGTGGVWSEPPKCSISTPARLETVAGLLEISGNASDKDGEIIEVLLRIDKGDWLKAKGTEHWQYSLDTTKLADEGHEIFVRVSDDKGYTNFTTTRFIVDNSGIELSKNLTDVIWWKTYGGTGSDVGYSVQETSDGGLIIGAQTPSGEYDNLDIWLIKTDSTGEMMWDKTFGERFNDRCKAVKQTKDGGYIIVGQVEGGIPTGGGGYYTYGNLWLIKTNDKGNEEWNRTFGASKANIFDEGISVMQTSNGGYIVAGNTGTYTDDFRDMWVIKTDSNGKEHWNTTFEENTGYLGDKIVELSDGSYMILGTITQDSNTEHRALIKLDKDGNELWDKQIGNHAEIDLFSIKQTADEGFIIAGVQDIGFNEDDAILIKLDSVGDEEWSKLFGKENREVGLSAIQTLDGGYIFTGYTTSNSKGYSDIYVLKTNSKGEMDWKRTFGWNGSDQGYTIIQTSDGGYVISGSTGNQYTGANDVILIKIGSNGGGEIITGPPEVSINNPENLTIIKGLFRITGEASGNTKKIESIEIKIDDGSWIIANGTYEWYLFLETNDYEDGEHTIFARSYDGEEYSNFDQLVIEFDNIKDDVDNEEPDEDPPDEDDDKKPPKESLWILATVIAVIVSIVIIILAIIIRRRLPPPNQPQYSHPSDHLR